MSAEHGTQPGMERGTIVLHKTQVVEEPLPMAGEEMGMPPRRPTAIGLFDDGNGGDIPPTFRDVFSSGESNEKPPTREAIGMEQKPQSTKRERIAQRIHRMRQYAGVLAEPWF